VQFEISHEFDAPLDAIELALMSPNLGSELGERFAALETIEALSHQVTDKEFLRIWRYQARAPLKILRGFDIARDMMTWEEHSNYRLAEHRAQWHVVPRPGIEPDAAWRKNFSAKGHYALAPIANGRTRRTVSGVLAISLKLIGSTIERIAIAELRKAYQAEADALRALCTLP
jgi:hypothetical protein